MENQCEHLSPDEFTKYGELFLSWIADYHRRVEALPVLSRVKPGEISAKLPLLPPLKGEPISNILKDLDEIVLPGITHWQSPYFFGYFPANTSPPSILAELVSSGLGVQGMLWATSPACTEIEMVMMEWVLQMMGLPKRFSFKNGGGGVIQDSASSATLCAILCARERATNYRSNKYGCNGRLVAYTSTQGHSSIEKGIKIAGIGSENLRFIEVDENYAMIPEALERAIKMDIERGLIPTIVCATIGTTSTTAIDPVDKIGEICRKYNIWLHIDGAMAGSAAICPEFRYMFKGLEYADSYCFNPHKWLLTNFDCDCFYVADRNALINTFSITPEYLKNQVSMSGEVVDYRDWQVPLGRRFRALKLWFVIRHYGVEGLQAFIRHHVGLAQEFASWIQQSDDFELCAPVPLNLVCFRHKSDNEFNEKLLNKINHSGEIFLTHTKLSGKFILRMCIGQTYTQRHHVQKGWEVIKRCARELV